VAWVLLIHLLVVCVCGWLSVTSRVVEQDLVRFVALLAAAVLHMVLTRESEERRRGVHRPGGEYVDQTSLWLCSGALVLPLPLALLLLVVVRTQRYHVARRPPHTWVFTTSAIAVSVLGADAVATLTSLRAWLTAAAPPPAGPADMLWSVLAVVLAVACYFAGQAAVIGVVRGLSTDDWSRAGLFGDRAANTAIFAILALAVGIAVLQMLSPPLALLLVPVVVRSARTEQRLQQAQVDRARLTADALHDPLTGLLNRRGFEPAAALALLDDERLGEPTAHLFVDIDNFKDWNTRIGHHGADELLKAVAEELRRQTRHHDLACRFGGEEMVVLLRGLDREQALEAGERIRIAVEGLRTAVTLPAGGKPIRIGTDGVPSCTVSVGIAVTQGGERDLDELARRADEALFRAKNTGRNRVVVAAAPSTDTVVEADTSPKVPATNLTESHVSRERSTPSGC
jgi:diguanylate cyclase (GGDEF)-like protein